MDFREGSWPWKVALGSALATAVSFAAWRRYHQHLNTLGSEMQPEPASQQPPSHKRAFGVLPASDSLDARQRHTPRICSASSSAGARPMELPPTHHRYSSVGRASLDIELPSPFPNNTVCPVVRHARPQHSPILSASCSPVTVNRNGNGDGDGDGIDAAISPRVPEPETSFAQRTLPLAATPLDSSASRRAVCPHRLLLAPTVQGPSSSLQGPNSMTAVHSEPSTSPHSELIDPPLSPTRPDEPSLARAPPSRPRSAFMPVSQIDSFDVGDMDVATDNFDNASDVSSDLLSPVHLASPPSTPSKFSSHDTNTSLPPSSPRAMTPLEQSTTTTNPDVPGSPKLQQSSVWSLLNLDADAPASPQPRRSSIWPASSESLVLAQSRRTSLRRSPSNDVDSPQSRRNSFKPAQSPGGSTFAGFVQALNEAVAHRRLSNRSPSNVDVSSTTEAPTASTPLRKSRSKGTTASATTAASPVAAANSPIPDIALPPGHPGLSVSQYLDGSRDVVGSSTPISANAAARCPYAHKLTSGEWPSPAVGASSPTGAAYDGIGSRPQSEALPAHAHAALSASQYLDQSELDLADLSSDSINAANPVEWSDAEDLPDLDVSWRSTAGPRRSNVEAPAWRELDGTEQVQRVADVAAWAARSREGYACLERLFAPTDLTWGYVTAEGVPRYLEQSVPKGHRLCSVLETHNKGDAQVAILAPVTHGLPMTVRGAPCRLIRLNGDRFADIGAHLWDGSLGPIYYYIEPLNSRLR